MALHMALATLLALVFVGDSRAQNSTPIPTAPQLAYQRGEIMALPVHQQ